MERFFEDFTVMQSDLSPLSTSYTLPLKRKSLESLAGYPADRFELTPPSEFICFMCENVVKKPLECKKCGRLCCEECFITKSIRLELDSHRLFKCKICYCMQEPKKPSQLLLRMIAELKIKCRNFEAGCSSYVCLSEYGKHEMSCPFSEVKCRNFAECKIQGLIRDFFEIEGGICFSSLNRRGRGKSYACSERCKILAEFEKMIADKRTDKAVEEYIRVLRRNNV